MNEPTWTSRRAWLGSLGALGAGASMRRLLAPGPRPLTPRSSQQAPDGPFFLARTYGATGDGRTNDAPAIQQAMTAAAAVGGGIVLLQAGTFLIEQSLELLSGVTLQGTSRRGTAIRGSRSGLTMVHAGKDVAHAGVSDLAIQGQGIALVGLHFEGATDCFAERVVSTNFATSGHCCYMSWGASRNVWRDIVADGGPASSLMLYNNAQLNLPNNDNLIVNCVGSHSSGNMGLEIRRSHRNRVIGGHFFGNGEAGINVEEGASENVVIAAVTESNKIGLVFLGDAAALATRNIFEGCVVARNDGPGIQAFHATNNLFTGCDIYQNSIGVDLRWEPPASEDNRFANCSIRDNRTHGIVFGGTAGGSVTGGQVRGNARGGIRLDEASNVILSGVDARENGGADIVEIGAADYNVIMGCRAKNIRTVGKNSRVFGNPGLRDT
jgi:hypothetical protein